MRDPFPGNIIPVVAHRSGGAPRSWNSGRCRTGAATNRAGANNFLGNYTTIFNRDNLTARIDHAFSDNNRFYFRYLFNQRSAGHHQRLSAERSPTRAIPRSGTSRCFCSPIPTR